ncbi:MAG: hypothetical protein A4E55_00230 [Pelotomaculum sp. PtaU1.Bin035]|nr:MAG: hypothetical protein A4E55_00230 [Pelotomaculum sp. PtaU1.Bin035]
MNDFRTDLKYSLDERENEIFDRFYYRVFPGLKLIELVTDLELQRKGIDKILHFKSGKQVTIDEKKRRVDYGDILLELWSIWEQRKRGWLYTCQCDYIVYAVMPVKAVYLLPAFLLKRAWLTNCHDWSKIYRIVDAKNNWYVTKSIAIPVNILLNAISHEMQQRLTGGT